MIGRRKNGNRSCGWHLESARMGPILAGAVASGIQAARGFDVPGLKLSPIEYFKRQC
jgi:hypothetical protein